jgi:hypothetical protein
MKKHLSLLLISLLLFQYSYSANRADTKIKVNNTEYTLCVNLPKGFDSNKTYPLVLALHYCGGNASQYCDALAGVCDSLQVIAISPEDNSGSELASTEFIKVSIDSVISKYKIDTKNVYFTGMSCNGVTVLREGLAKVYPFKGIFPWAPYLSNTDNKIFNFQSEMPTTISIGTADSKLGLSLSFYDSLKIHNNKSNLVLAMQIGHVLAFSTFADEMIRSYRYINDTGAISINKIEDVSMKDNEVKEISVDFTYAGNKNLNVITRTTNPSVMPLPAVVKSNNTITITLDPNSIHYNNQVYVVLEIAEQNGMAIQQAVFKVKVETTFNAVKGINNEVFSIYPVPAKNQLFFKSNETNVNIEVSDFAGKQIMIKNNFDTSMPLNISELKKGSYLLAAKGSSFQKTMVFIVE